jgi:hypothetical protein
LSRPKPPQAGAEGQLFQGRSRRQRSIAEVDGQLHPRRTARNPMKLINQHFAECSFCGCKYPPQWVPIVYKGNKYCSEKCVYFFDKNLTDETPADMNKHKIKQTME